ncbi:Conserved hypothetical protein [Candidatus Hamiltonella defensa (Bemisia tabaci)]|nr:Conserved hypothetical protein [Candidatus Hamiltonella defensa (Bemisia tabaci)]
MRHNFDMYMLYKDFSKNEASNASIYSFSHIFSFDTTGFF